MKTPAQLKAEESKNDKIKARQLKKSLEEEVERAIGSAQITSEGGNFHLTSFEPNNLSIVQDYCQRQGWECDYNPRQNGGYSMTTKSDYEYTIHNFTLKPKQK